MLINNIGCTSGLFLPMESLCMILYSWDDYDACFFYCSFGLTVVTVYVLVDSIHMVCTMNIL